MIGKSRACLYESDFQMQTESRANIRYTRLDNDARVKGTRRAFLRTLLTIGLVCIIGASGIYLSYYRGDCKTVLPPNTTVGPAVSPSPQCSTIPPPDQRFDCWAEEYGATPAKCAARGCCWLPVYDSFGDVPWCYYPAKYSLYSVEHVQKRDTGISAHLINVLPSGWPGDVVDLTLNITYTSKTQLNFKISDSQHQRYEVPIPMASSGPPVTASETDYVVDIPSAGPFYITVTRKSTGKVLFSSRNATPLVFADQFIQIGTQLSSKYIYGLGEHMSRFLLDTNWTKLAFWARDQPPQRHANLYGSHPFYLNIEADNNAHGVFLLNSNAMEAEIQPAPVLTYRTTGGILDFFIFSGPTPDNVVEQYTALIGRPFMPPYWALGFHLCRWGYNGTEGMKKVIDRMRAANMPYDTQWNDIDYMQSHLDWTYDSEGRYKGLPDVVQDLHDHGQHYVMIIDPGISNTQKSGTYPPYDEGLQQNVFIKTPDGSAPIIGKVWPGDTAFPDFFHPNTSTYWTKQAAGYHKMVPFDGLWTDMNEPSNFVFGSTNGCPKNSLEDPPFVPQVLLDEKLRAKTLCASAKQYPSTHYNLHNLYGHSEAVASKSALDSIVKKRSIVISRSTFPSTGTHAGHWLGDNQAEWDHTYYSITGMLSFQLFGIPLVGADICGFMGNTSPELCTRWMQLGAFYPFMRNHNTLGNNDQDPAVFDSATQDIMRDALRLRYWLLPYLYSLFYKTHTQGTPVVRPVFFQYPVSDYNVTYMVDVQFMWGSGLLITPVTSQDVTTGEGYLPQDRWYDLYNHTYIDSPGHYIWFDLPKERINVQVRGGTIIPIQEPAVTTTVARKNPFGLLVALAPDTSASGELYWDDGESSDSISSGAYNLIQFYSSKDVLSSTVVRSGYRAEPMVLGQVTIMGVEVGPTSVTVNGQVVQGYIYSNKTIEVYGLNLDLLKPFNIAWLV